MEKLTRVSRLGGRERLPSQPGVRDGLRPQLPAGRGPKGDEQQALAAPGALGPMGEYSLGREWGAGSRRQAQWGAAVVSVLPLEAGEQPLLLAPGPVLLSAAGWTRALWRAKGPGLGQALRREAGA